LAAVFRTASRHHKPAGIAQKRADLARRRACVEHVMVTLRVSEHRARRALGQQR
jgi:hypothetical protein